MVTSEDICSSNRNYEITRNDTMALFLYIRGDWVSLSLMGWLGQTE